jgi:hypothetical protein
MAARISIASQRTSSSASTTWRPSWPRCAHGWCRDRAVPPVQSTCAPSRLHPVLHDLRLACPSPALWHASCPGRVVLPAYRQPRWAVRRRASAARAARRDGALLAVTPGYAVGLAAGAAMSACPWCNRPRVQEGSRYFCSHCNWPSRRAASHPAPDPQPAAPPLRACGSGPNAPSAPACQAAASAPLIPRPDSACCPARGRA